MTHFRPLRVAALVDLPRSKLSGGHVRGWEYRAKAVAASDMPLDLTVYFSGPENTEVLAPHVRLRQLPPVFSTKHLTFMPYVPDHTDLAPYHPALAKELPAFDIIHTTDAYFAFARTAERVAQKKKIPLVTSFHTDTPSYSRVFTRKMIESLFGKKGLGRFLNETCRLPEKEEQSKLKRLRKHLACCREALVIRPEDRALVEKILGPEHAHSMRTVVDKQRFNPNRADRARIESEFKVPPGRFLVLFVGRLDEGKNIYTLIEAMEKLIGRNMPVHLIAAGVGPADKNLTKSLGDHVSVPGFVEPDMLGCIMASGDVLALVSEIEIRSLIVTEALASGMPVAVSAKSGIADLIPEAHEALRIVHGGADAWAEALGELAANPAQRATMRQAGARYAQSHIAIWEEIMRDEFLKVWQKAAGK